MGQTGSGKVGPPWVASGEREDGLGNNSWLGQTSDEMLTPHQVQKILGYAHINSVYALADRGEIGYYKFARAVRFSRAEVEVYIKSRYNPATKPSKNPA